MKRFALFQGEVYYPTGGWYDLRGTYDTKEEAIEASKPLLDTPEYQWAYVIDLTDGNEVWRHKRNRI